jgi:TPR repeat protein
MAQPSASIWRWIILTVVGLAAALFLLIVVVEPEDAPDAGVAEFAALVAKAQAGDRVAQFKVAGYHARGEAVAQDLTEAAKWLLLSAQQGYAPAQNNIAVCYATGAGVEKDLAQAIAWIRKSADQGYARAQCYLGLSFAKGEGVPRDQAQAIDWFRKSAAQGFPDALNHLGYCHSQGRGVPKDEAEAYACWAIAARSHEGAARNLELLEKKISDQNRLRGGVRRDELLRQIEANKSKGP